MFRNIKPSLPQPVCAMAWESLNFDTSSGALLASSWLNMMLYTSQVALSIYCLCHLTMTRWLRYWIFTSLVLDGACSIVDVANVYAYLVMNNVASYPTLSWTVPTGALLTYTSASIAQAFFCYRYWTLTSNKWITGWIIFLIIAHMLCNLVSNMYLLVHPDDLILVIPLVITNAVMCAATDITIAGSLAWACLHIQSAYAHTKSLLRRVMIQALTCGFTTAMSTVLVMVFLFTVWNASFTIFAALGRIYSLTVLITLMLLKTMSRSDPSSFRIDGDGGFEPVILTPVCDVQFGHTLDTETGKTQTSSDKSESTADSTHPHFEALAKNCIRTV
ncbi:uncharacterized protein EV420DRAFT_766193 [Desarmillaria tabescens]|uniref:Transmembrane protein n=1 Tax=Armillaria tabescens TaxID=1929756 RepID=A0AA39MXG6_ARMTA|nr:uncharacterized protein EV420DRAFT_766193 [Desarmillaria tabescens]KAK0449823.1 hypothetical protein EV420DRAFT_766193 [Desarmillaria tabescens]